MLDAPLSDDRVLENHYRIAVRQQPLEHARVAVLSDFHLARDDSRYLLPWSKLLQKARRGGLDQVVINGDFMDRGAYVKPDADRARFDRKAAMHLRELLNANPKLKVTYVRGNHDMITEYLDVLDSVQKDFSERFAICDVFLLGQAAFTHGDGKTRQPSPANVLYKERASRPIGTESEPRGEGAAEQTEFAANYEKYCRKIATRLRTWLGEETFRPLRHVFFGHVHPDRIVAEGFEIENKRFHITGTSYPDKPCGMYEILFHGNEVEKVSVLYQDEPQPKPDWAGMLEARARHLASRSRFGDR